mgnify:CR=1 FL=1
MSRSLLGVLALAVACLPALAQPAPTDAAKSGIAKFKEERADAEKTFTKAELAAADEQAAKAEAALAGGNAEQAARLITEARWQLPVQQKNLPENVSRVLGAARLRHGDRVNGLAYSPDGTRLVSASRDGTVRVWDVGNGRELVVYRGHEAAPFDDEEARADKGVVKKNVRRVFGVAISADGTRVASVGADEVHVWTAADGKLVKTLKGHKGDVTCVAFAPKSADVLLTGGADKRFVVWDVTKDKPTFTSEEQTTAIEVVAFSPDERYLVAGDASGSAVVFAVGKYDKLVYGSKVMDSKGVRAVAFTRDAAGLVVGGEAGQLKVVGGPGGPESGLGNLVTRLDGHDKNHVNGLGLTPDGKLLASIADSRTVIVWELAAGKQIRAFQTEASAKKGTCLAVRPDGRQVAAGFDSGQIRLFPLSAADDHRTFGESKDKLMAAAYSPDGKQFATAGGDAVVRVYDATSGGVKAELKGHKIAVTALAWVNNTTLASAGADKLVKVWDVPLAAAKDAAGHTVAVLAVATDPAGKVLLSGGADKSVRGWNPSTGQPTKLKYEGTSAVCAIALSPDGKRAAVGLANGKLQLFALKDDTLTLTGEAAGAHSAGVASVAFHPNGDKVATCGGDGLVCLWTASDAGTPAKERVCDLPFKPTAGSPPMPVTSVAFSPDGKQLVGGGSEGVVRVWETASGGEVRGLRGHTGWVTSVQFSADGKAVLSCGVDAAAKVFDLPRGEAAATGHSAQVNCVAVSRDGKYVATGSGDMTVKVWDLATGREVATLTGEMDKGGLDSAGILTVVFVGNDRVAAAGHEKVLRTWTFGPTRLVNTKQLKESAFLLAADPDGTGVAAAWINLSGSGDKTKAGFDLFPAGGDVVSSEVNSKGKDDATSTAALSPDAKWGVIGGADGVISIWDLSKKERIGGDWPILAKTRVYDMGVTPDRKTVVVIDDNGAVSVGDTAKREVTAKVKAVDGEVRGVVVAPTADTFATLSGDGTVKAWDMKCKEVRTWKLPHAPTCAVFTADGKRLITGNQDGTAFVLELPAK